ncbi:MAG: cell wall-binding repeat-containing protein [Actinomycetota bacterium]|nr:cell wall-binding repeat-containing protein [Actinomycetota bacterium]
MASTPAEAGSAPVLVQRLDVVPGLVREVYRHHTGQGPSNVQLLRLAPGHPRVRVVPELGQGVIPGRETVLNTTRRLGEDAVGAVNASFSNPACPVTDPPGEPCGLLVRDGIVLSENVLNGASWPGAFALFDPAETWRRPYDVGRPSFEGYLRFYDGTRVDITAVNRQPTANEVVAFNRAYGPSTTTPAGTIEFVFPDLQLRALTQAEVVMPAPSASGGAPIPAGGTVVAATGTHAATLQAHAGERVEAKVYTAGTEWAGAQQAVAAGPLIVKDGSITPSTSWYAEGFSHEHHNEALHPRTVVAFTGGNEMLLLTVDGRQPDSVGLTTQQTAELVRALGAVDAVMMDGGGSTTMVADHQTVNVPCSSPSTCGQLRPVASSLVVWSPTPNVDRLAGPDRFSTAAAIADAGWPGGAGTVVLANAASFADALAGGPLATAHGAPLLLVDTDQVHPSTAGAISRLRPQRALVLGGPAVVSDRVIAELRRSVPEVRRVFGADRTATAASVARELGAPSGRAFLASAATFPDALSATVPAARSAAPLLLTWPDQLASAAAEALAVLGVREVVLAGGGRAVSDAVVTQLQARGMTVTRVAGANRYETSARLVEWAVAATGLPTTAAVLASGAAFPDALSGGPFAASRGAGLLLTDPAAASASPGTWQWLTAHDIDHGWVLGGRAAVSSRVLHELQAAVDAR